MAAPFYAYTNKELNVQDSTGTKKHYVAKLDTSYNTMKSRFYLDDFVNVDGVGVIGCVTIGSTNESMHNISTRGGVGRIGNMIMLNDAGLNTFGLTSIIQTKKHHTNFIAIQINGLSSYYSETSSWGIQVKESSENWAVGISLDLGTLNKNEAIPTQYVVMRFNYDYLDTLDIRTFHTNTEGTRYSPVVSRTLDLSPITQQISSYVPDSGSACDNPTSTPLVLMTQETRDYLGTFTSATNVNTGQYIYQGEPFNNPLDSNGEFITVPTGYYRGLDGVYSNVFFISPTGEVLRRTVCTPAIPHLGYLAILPGFTTPENPSEMIADLNYTVDEVVSTAYTIEGYCQEYVSSSPIGTGQYFELSVSANSSVTTWITKPDLVNTYGGKFRLINVIIDPNNIGTITQINEI